MKLILHQATLAITEIDFEPGPFRFQIEQQHLDFAAGGVARVPSQQEVCCTSALGLGVICGAQGTPL